MRCGAQGVTPHKFWALALALLGILGCKASSPEAGAASSSESTVVEPGAAADPDTPSPPAEPALPPPPMGRVRGIVRLAEGADLPRYTRAHLGFDDERIELPEGCTRPSDADLTPVRLTDGRALVGVGIASTGSVELFRRVPSPEGREHTLRIRDCRLEPRFLAAVVGDTLVVTNEVEYGYLLGYTTLVAHHGVGRGQSHRIEITRPGVQAVGCEIAAGCGRTDVMVLGHPVAATTGAEGRFELEIPANDDVVLHAWHPVFGGAEGIGRVRVAPGETAEVEITLTPRAPRPPTPELVDSGLPAEALPH